MSAFLAKPSRQTLRYWNPRTSKIGSHDPLSCTALAVNVSYAHASQKNRAQSLEDMSMDPELNANITAKITPAAVIAFVKNHDSVEVVDLNGKIRTLQSDVAEILDLIVNANRFHFQGKWYTRAGFSRLLDSLD